MESYQAVGTPDDESPDNDRSQVANEEPKRLSREQMFIMVSTASLNFSSMVCYSILGPFFPREAEKKGVSSTIVGFIFGCFALFNFLTSLIMGKYLVQIGAKFMFIAGMFVSGCVTILFGFLDKAPDGPIFIGLCFLVRAMDAIGFAAAVTASFSILINAFPQNVATVMGILEIFTGLGLVLGPPIGGFLYQSFGYEIPFIALGSVMLLMVPLNMFILPNYNSIPKKDSFLKLIVLPKVAILCLNIFGLSSSIAFLDPTMSLFVLEKFKLPAGYVGLVFLALALPYSLSSPLLGFLSDKKPRLRKWLLIIGAFLTTLCYIFLGPAPILHIESQLWLFILMLVLDGFALAMIAIPIYPEAINCAYENGFEEGLSLLGLVSGLFGALWALGSFVGPTLGGFLNEKLGFEWSAAIQGGFTLLSGLAAAIYYTYEAIQRKSQLWLFILMLVLDGFALAMIAIPIYPEAINCAYENGFEEGLSLLGLVSGLFGALWALGSFVGPTLGGFLNEKLGFEWSAAIQGGFTLLSGLAAAIYYTYEAIQRKRSPPGIHLGSEQERTLLLNGT